MADRKQSFVARAGPWLRYLVVCSLGLLALALTAGSLGNLSQVLNGVLAVSSLLLLLFVCPRRAEHPPTWQWVGAIAISVASLLVVARGGCFGLLGAALFFFALTLLPLRQRGTATALLLTSFLFALYHILVAYVPAWWHVQQWFSISFSWMVGVGLMLGPTALGTSLFVLFALFAVSVFLLNLQRRFPSGDGEPEPGHHRKRGRSVFVLVAWIVGLVLATGAFIWLHPPVGSWLLTNWPESPAPSSTPTAPPTLTYLESQLLLFVLLWLVTIVASLLLRPRPLRLMPKVKARGWLIVGLVLLALGTAVLTLEPPYQPQRGVVLFHDTGHLDWENPQFGSYGAHSGGDFGLWPAYLEAFGYEARIGPLTGENLKDAQAVVLINVPEMFEQEEKERLLRYIEDGGGLIIWGEHTGVGRIREPVNDLLASVPIRLKFDSAVPVRLGWADGLNFLPHPATYGVENAIDMVIAVGASLEIAPPARPMIVGQFGHSDAGDVNNRARNYVGDMVYNSGERLGDVVLAAEASYGQGRIVVLGDTTPLGSVNLMTNMDFQVRLLDWMTAQPLPGWTSLLRNGWLAGLLLIAAGVCLILGRSRIGLAGAALVLVVVLAFTTMANRAQGAPPVPTGPIAYIDVSHQERLDRLLWEDTSIGGLAYNLVRNQALPMLLRELDADRLSGAELLVVIAPGESLSAGEIRTITQWIEEGGHLLISVGWEESEASKTLLDAFGLEVGHIPLGPAEVEREAGLVRFYEAWPVHSTSSQASIIVEGYGYPLALHQPWGKGGVVLIGDSRFLEGSILEGETDYREGNILLLRDMMQQYLGFDGSTRLTTGEGP